VTDRVMLLNLLNIFLFCSPGTVEYRESITIINRILEDHKSTMVFAKPDLDWCDLAIQVSIYLLYYFHVT